MKKGSRRKLLITERGTFDSVDELVKYLKHAIDVDHLSQEKIAKKLGCSIQQLWRYRRIFNIDGLPSAFLPGSNQQPEEPPMPVFSWD